MDFLWGQESSWKKRKIKEILLNSEQKIQTFLNKDLRLLNGDLLGKDFSYLAIIPLIS